MCKTEFKRGSDKSLWHKCDYPGCDKTAQDVTRRKDNGGFIRLRTSKLCRSRFGGKGWICGYHYSQELKEKTGHTVQEGIAFNAGYEDYYTFQKDRHPYRKYTKDYCENIDGRLGTTCTATIVIPSQLTVDHKNGKPWDNRPENLQTLCRNCHDLKGRLFGDGTTTGRKGRIKNEVRRIKPVKFMSGDIWSVDIHSNVFKIENNVLYEKSN